MTDLSGNTFLLAEAKALAQIRRGWLVGPAQTENESVFSAGVRAEEWWGWLIIPFGEGQQKAPLPASPSSLSSQHHKT